MTHQQMMSSIVLPTMLILFGILRSQHNFSKLRADMKDIRRDMKDFRGEVRDVCSELTGMRAELNQFRAEIVFRLDNLEHFALRCSALSFVIPEGNLRFIEPGKSKRRSPSGMTS